MGSSASPALKVYNRRVILASLAYGALLVGGLYTVKHMSPVLPVRVALALLPGLAIVGIFVALARYLVEERDEYLRARFVRQMLWATGFALSVGTLWGFLQVFDVVPTAPMYWVAILWFFGLGLAGCVIRVLDQ